MNMRFRDEAVGAVLLLAAACLCCTPFRGWADVAPNPSLAVESPVARDTMWGRRDALAAVSRMPSEIDPTPAPVLLRESGAECGHCDGTGRSKPDGCGLRVTNGDPEPDLAELEPTPAKKPSVVQERSLLAPQPASLVDAHPSRPVQAAAPSLSADHDEPGVRWLSSLDVGRQAARRTNQPALVYWYGESCRPCQAFWRGVLLDQDVQELLNRSFVCVKINTDGLNRTPAGQQELRAWQIDSIPQVLLVTPDWKTARRLQRTNDYRNFVEQLHAGEQWSAQQVRINLAARKSQSVPLRLAVLRSPSADAADQVMPHSIPRKPTEQVWRPTRARVQQVQYAPSPTYGSNGGSGAYRSVLMNGGPYGVNGGNYPAVNGWTSSQQAVNGYYAQPVYYQPPVDRRPDYYGAYGSPNFSTVHGGYFAQPSYHPPRVYHQPSYYGNLYPHPPAVVCTPEGCFLQR